MPRLSEKKQKLQDEKILLIVKTFLEYECRISDDELSSKLNIPSSTLARYILSDRTKELIGIDNYAYIKRERIFNKQLGRKKGGSKKKDG